MIKQLLFSAVFGFAATSASAAPFALTGNDVSAIAGINASQYQDFDNVVMDYMTYQNATSGTVGMVKDGRLVLVRSYGVADQANNLQTHPDNIFRVASLGKTLSGVAITKLYQDGLLDLDAQVFGVGGILENRVQPVGGFKNNGFDNVVKEPARYEDITVRHIMHHVSGMSITQNYDPMFSHNAIRRELNLDHPPSCNEVANYYTARYSLGAVPGRVFSYSNIGYCIAHLIIEEVSGQSYEAYLQQNIMQTGSMAAGSASLPAQRVPQEVDYVSTYTEESVFDLGTYVPVADGGFYSEGGGGMATSSKDFLHLLSTFLGPVNDQSLLNNASVDQMLGQLPRHKKEKDCFDVEATLTEHVSAGRAYTDEAQVCSGFWYWQTCETTTTYFATGSGNNLGTNGSATATLNTKNFGSSFNANACPAIDPWGWDGFGVGIQKDSKGDLVIWNIGGVPGAQAQFVRWYDDGLMWFMAFNIESASDNNQCKQANGGSFDANGNHTGVDYNNDADKSWLCHQDPMMQKARRQIDVSNYPSYNLFDKTNNATAPTINFTTVANGSCENITGTVADDRWVKKLEIYVGGQWQPVHLELASFTSPQCVTPGDTSIALRATDDHDATTTVQIYSGPVDLRPTITLDNVSTASDCISLSGTASDDDAIVAVEYLLDGNAYNADTVSGNTWSATRCGLADKNYNVKARATDTAAQTTETSEQLAMVSTQGPSLTNVQTDVNGDCIHVVGNMYDVNGITSVKVSIGGGIYYDAVINTGIFDYNVCGFASGNYSVAVRALDAAGDVNEVAGPEAVVEIVTQACVTAKNTVHISEGRAAACTIYYNPHACANGSGTDLGYAARWYDQTSSVKETSPGYWEKVTSCP